MSTTFTSQEIRVLGVLMEKQLTTPEYYPMSANGLKNGCNQKSNRDPVVDYDENLVIDTLTGLRHRDLATIVSGAGSRVRKYEHRMKAFFHLSLQEQALLTALMVRGAQTSGELRSRTSRMVDFDNIAAVETTLADLMSSERKPMPLVGRLPVRPGQKEHRYQHLLAGEIVADEELPEALPVASEANWSKPPEETRTSTSPDHLAALQEEVADLARELATLRDEFLAFKRQFE